MKPQSTLSLLLRAVAQERPVDLSVVTEPISGTELVGAGRFHRVVPALLLAAQSLAQQRPSAVHSLHVLEAEAATSVMRSRQTLAEALPVLERLARRVPILLGKGVHLASFIYPAEEPRVSNDVDVYVREADVDQAIAIMQEAGLHSTLSPLRQRFYRSYRGQLPFVGRGMAHIDLHWWLNNSPLHPIASRFDLDHVWRRSTPARWNGFDARFPRTVDALLLNAVYMAYGSWFQRLRMLIDHRRLLSQTRATELVHAAREVGLRRLVAVSLAVTEAATGCPVAPQVYACLGEQAAALRTPAQQLAATRFQMPSYATRLAHFALDHRIKVGRFVVRTFEAARILDLTDDPHRSGLLTTLREPSDRMMRMLYLSDRVEMARIVHPVALAIGTIVPAVFGHRRRGMRRQPR